MIADAWNLVGFFLIIVFATYFQTITGFGLAMIIIGLASGLNIASISDLATLVSILAISNGFIVLRGLYTHINWKLINVSMIAIVPSSIIGVLLLDYMHKNTALLLQLLLGLTLVYAGMDFIIKHRVLIMRSSSSSFFIYGFLGGIIGGLFGIAGPPLIYQFYRQPMDLRAIRGHLILILTLLAGVRTLFVSAQGQISYHIVLLSVITIPIIMIATIVAKKYPPKISDETARRGAFFILTIMGLSLIVPVFYQI